MDIKIPEFPVRDTPSFDGRPIEYYVLDDGRVWSVAEAKFVDSFPDGSATCPIRSEDGASAAENLIACLDFYKHPKGEFRTDAECAAEARGKRNQLIAETDYLMMPDYPLDAGKKAAVLAYRQALRDVPEQAGFPRQIDWPVKP